MSLLGRLLDRWRETREMLDGPSDHVGECDGCHAEGVALWVDVRTVGEGDFAYCHDCWMKHLRRLETSIRAQDVGDDQCPICGLNREKNYGPFGCERCGFGEEDD